jgi:hypothetical protein
MLGMTMTASDFRKYIVRWRTEHDKTESGAAQIRVIGYCVYDVDACRAVFEHESHDVCEKVLAMILNDETKGNKC